MTDSTQCDSRGKRTVGGDKGMFVFQTQSASTMSRTIDHRSREMAKRDGGRKSTRKCKKIKAEGGEWKGGKRGARKGWREGGRKRIP